MVTAIPAGSRILDEDLREWSDEITSQGKKGIKARGNRQSNSTATTTEVGVLRLDDKALESGRAYRIETSNLRATGGANDAVTVRLRATTDGSTPTPSSTVIAEASADIDDVSTYEHLQLTVLRNPGSAETFSVLLTVARTQGTAGNASLGGGATFPVEVFITDIGATVADSGTDI